MGALVSTFGLLALAAAQAAPADGPASLPAAAANSVYPAEFFAASAPTTAFDIVRLIPGFVFDNGGAVRGFSGSAGNILIDGARPASKDDSLDDILRRMSASDVLRVEVIRGGAPGIDMQGKTVIANLVLRPHGALKGTITATTTRDPEDRYHGVLRGVADWSVGPVSFEVTTQIARYFDDGAGTGPWIRTNAAGAPIILGREDQFGLLGGDRGTAAVEFPIAHGRLRLTASVNSDPYHQTTADTLSLPPGREGEDVHFSEQTGELGARYDGAITRRANLEVVLLQQFGRSHLRDYFEEPASLAAVTGDDISDLFALAKHRGESIASARVIYTVTPTLTLNTGAEGDYNWLSTRTTFVRNGAPQMVPAANVHVAELRGEAFALADWRPHPKLNVEAGLRMEGSRLSSSGDVVSSQSFAFPKPRAVLTFSPDAADQLRLRVEREVTQLDFNDFAANQGYVAQGDVRAGNPRLVPQSDWVFEAAAEHRFWSGADAQVTARHFAISNVIDRAPLHDPINGDFDEPANIGSGSKDELAFTLNLPLDRLGVPRASLVGESTFRWSHVIDPTTGAGRPISGVFSSEWDLHFTQGLPRWKATWGLDLIGPFIQTFYRFSEIDTEKRRMYAVAYIEWKPTPDLAFRIDIKDLTNRSVEHGRAVWTDYRDASPYRFSELRELRSGRFITLRVVKSFH